MSSLIGYNRVYIKYIIGSVRKQPRLVYNKRLLLKISQYYRKITMLNSLFNNFIKKTPTQLSSCEYCGNFKITYFEEHLRASASIRWYFDTVNLKQSGFCTTCSFRILVSKRKYKNNLKNREPQKKQKLLQFSYALYVYVIFYYEIPWFYQEICF